MSRREEFRSGYGSVYRDDPSATTTIYRDDPGGYQGSSYDKFKELTDRISSNIFSITNNVTTLERAIRQIGTSKDSKQHRDRIHSTEQETNKLVRDTTRLIKQLSQTKADRQQKLQFGRLKNEFEETITRYCELQKRIADKVKSSTPLSSSLKSNRSQLSETAGWLDDTESQTWKDRDALIRQDEERRDQLQAQGQLVDEDVALIQEREERIRQLESDILDVNEIFRDLGGLVMEQGDMIDNIEDNVSKALDNVEAGTGQLQKASDYQKKSRKKICILIVILLVVAGIIALIIGLSVKK